METSGHEAFHITQLDLGATNTSTRGATTAEELPMGDSIFPGVSFVCKQKEPYFSHFVH